MGGIHGCGCKEVYRFPHTTYPYSSCICSFFAALKKCFLFFNIVGTSTIMCLLLQNNTWDLDHTWVHEKHHIWTSLNRPYRVYN